MSNSGEPKITIRNIAAARAQRDILERRGKPVPEKIRKIAELDPKDLPVTDSKRVQEAAAKLRNTLDQRLGRQSPRNEADPSS